jgi:hypothetical protein
MAKKWVAPRICVINVECDLVQYENKVKTFVGIHSQNLLGEMNLEVFKNHPRKTTCK